MHTRRSILKVGAAATALASITGTRSVFAAEPVTITQAVTALAFIQNYVADSQGFFETNDLNAHFIDTRGGGPDVQLVLAGRADFTTNDGAQVLPAVQRGQKLVCVLNLLNRSIINVTMSKRAAEAAGVSESSPFDAKVAALRNMRIGVTRPGSLTWQTARSNLINAGMNPDTDAQVIGVGGASALAAALENDNIDAMYISVPIGDRVVARGNGITLIDNARGEDPNIPYFLMEGLWVTPQFIDQHPETVGKVVKALHSASKFIVEKSSEEVANAVSHVFGQIDRDVLVAACDRVKGAVSVDGMVREEELDSTTKVLRENGFLTENFTVPDIFDPRFL
ncbi:ABC transporter substrate-binding protein [Roseibium sp. LAB1]